MTRGGDSGGEASRRHEQQGGRECDACERSTMRRARCRIRSSTIELSSILDCVNFNTLERRFAQDSKRLLDGSSACSRSACSTRASSKMDRGDHSQRRHLQAIDDAQWLGASQVVAGERLSEKAEERPLQPSLTSLKAGSKSSKMRFSESKGYPVIHKSRFVSFFEFYQDIEFSAMNRITYTSAIEITSYKRIPLNIVDIYVA